MSCHLRTGSMIFRATERRAARLRTDDSSHVAPVHKRPNQDAALQILLKDSFAVGEGSIRTP